MILAETQRLYLREMTVGDAPVVFQLNGDEEVMRYTGDKPFASTDEAVNFLATYDHYKKYGFGRWAVILKPNEEFLGWCGLKYTPSTNEYDVGFRFFKNQWGKGYATESALKALELGFFRFGMSQILGRVMKNNAASINVLEKIGMNYWKDNECGGQSGLVYQITKEEFSKK